MIAVAIRELTIGPHIYTIVWCVKGYSFPLAGIVKTTKPLCHVLAVAPGNLATCPPLYLPGCVKGYSIPLTRIVKTTKPF